MAVTNYKLSDHIKNDTFEGVEFTFQDGDGVGIDLTGATVAIKFRQSCKTGVEVAEKTTAAGVTLTDAVNGVVTLDKFVIDWEIGTYYWDVQITAADGDVNTYIQGTLNVIQDVTY